MAHGGLTPLAGQQWPRSVTRPGSWAQALVGPLQGCLSQPGFKEQGPRQWGLAMGRQAQQRGVTHRGPKPPSPGVVYD